MRPFGATDPATLLPRLMAGTLGDAVARPWFDRLALPLVTDWYLPLSRAWAAAEIHGHDIEAFRDAVRGLRLPATLLHPAIAAVVRARDRHAAAAVRWEAAVFGADDPGPEVRLAAERERQDAAHAHMATRAGFAPLHLLARFAAVAWRVDSPDAMEAAHGARLTGSDVAFGLPGAAPAVTVSRPVPRAYGCDYWLRYASPGLGDTAWARVREPAGVAAPPTVIFAHGVCMEGEFWRETADAVGGLVEAGIRVVQPEAPWHGRRRLPGTYGGEPLLAGGPAAMATLLGGQVGELACLARWARARGSGRVVFGGVSLGALTAQLASRAAAAWPEAARPDGLFLVATTGRLADVAFAGSLARRLGLPGRLRDAGWTPALLDRWSPLVDPAVPPAVASDHIVMLLGSADDLTPFAGSRALAEAWDVPAENLFVRARGHFSISLGLARDRAPLDRLLALLR